MKPGGKCKKTQKRAFGSHEEAVRKGARIFERKFIKYFRTYVCPFCGNWHLTTQQPKPAASRD